MKKILSLLVIASFLLSGAVLASINTPKTVTPAIEDTTSTAEIKTIEKTIHFSEPSVVENGKYVIIKTDNSNNVLKNEENPMIPYRVETVEFPIGTKIVSVEVQHSEPKEMELTKKIAPAPVATATNMQNSPAKVIEGKIYNSNEPYPQAWDKWNVGVGLDGYKHVIYLSVQLYPSQYNAGENKLSYVTDMDVKIKYTPPSKPLLTNDVYDLLIITPSEFSDALQPLVEHKNSHGVSTMLVTLDEIYNGNYFSVQGRDDAEKIKYFIKDAIEEWGIKYVMLVGGRHGGIGTEKWWCPVRYTHLDDGSHWEASYISDLYYADIYKYDNGNATFDDWDSNGNGKFAEWKMTGRDKMDFYPDVYIGRLACRNSYEAKKMVEKIITYETTTYGQDWFKKMVGIGGDTFPDQSDPYYDGELSILESKDYMEEVGIETTTLFTSDNTLTGPDDIINAVSQGCGFLNFEGHGNPMSWANHPPYDGDTWIGIDVTDFYKFSNTGMYPVCMIGGCHNSQFNVSILNLLKFGEIKDIYYKSEWSPESFGWWIVRMADKGAIASIGNTGLGYGAIGDNNDDGIPDTLQFYGGFIDGEFFRVYAEEGKDILGETYGITLTNYIMKFPPMEDQIDAKTVEEWVLLGDPSLKIGGYPS